MTSICVIRSNSRSTVQARSWRRAGSWCVSTQREATGWCQWSLQRLWADSSSSSATTTSLVIGGSRWWMWRMPCTSAPNPRSLSAMTLPSRSWGESVLIRPSQLLGVCFYSKKLLESMSKTYTFLWIVKKCYAHLDIRVWRGPGALLLWPHRKRGWEPGECEAVCDQHWGFFMLSE